jgi:hypothetical protein
MFSLSRQWPTLYPMALYGFSNPNSGSPHFSAMNCVLTPEPAIYCSSELSLSGLRQYNEMQKHGVKSAADLKRKRGEDWV